MTIPSEIPENTPALKRALVALKDMRAKLEAVERAKTEPIAIVGMGCRFPGGADNPELYWKILDQGKDVIREVPEERWNIDEYFDADPDAPGKMYVRKSGFIENVDQFDPQFFGISPREVASMDPQQRLLLEVTWEALEYAGIVPATLAGSKTGVFVGISTNDYSGLQIKNGDVAHFDAYIGTGTSFSVAAGRISYVLGLHGPTLALDTACSSALVAIHLACQSLRAGHSSLALAGGVSLILAPEGTVSMSKSHALAPDGYSKTFDAKADGYARGEGCGVVVLKRLSDALSDGDNIIGLIRGSAINHDGRSSGLTVPNGQAQQAVIRAALEDSGGIEPRQVHFVETHGTGTQLGDPIEVRALAAVLGKDRSGEDPLILGSVKANIGHLEAAAGMAGLIKVLLAFQKERIPSQLHFKDPNPNIDWDSSPVKVAGGEGAWPRNSTPRIAGINAFGFSGTNAHIVIEEPPLPTSKAGEITRPQHILTLSANNDKALSELAQRFVSHLETHPEIDLEEVTYTTNHGRTHFAQRLAVIGSTNEQILEKLNNFVAGHESNGLLTGQERQPQENKIVFLFTGQGSQYIDMGRKLYETQPVFRTALEKCNQLLTPYFGKSLFSILFPNPGEDSPIDETAYTQPAIFAIEYALSELWRSWGIIPSAVMGHSVGEYVAACVAGLFSLEDGVKLIAERGRLMQSLPHDGAMAAIFADYDQVAKFVAPYSVDVSIAAINGPENIVISGRETAVQSILGELAKEGVKSSRLAVSHAFHSPLMDPILDSFERIAASVKYSKPGISLISNLTGGQISFEEVSQPGYWRAHIRQPVQFHQAMQTLNDQGYTIFLEIGPQPTLLGMGQRCISGSKNLWLSSLRQRKDDWLQMLESLATLYLHGVPVDWEGYHDGQSHHSIPLPTYPFQRQRYWFKLRESSKRTDRQMLHPLLSYQVRSPLIRGKVFEADLSVDFPSFLNDHRIYETAVFPGTGYMEMALAAAQHAFEGKKCSLAEVAIREVLALPEEGEKKIQVTISDIESEKAAFDVFSLEEGSNGRQESWKHHASGSLVLGSEDEENGSPVDVAELKNSHPTQLNVSNFYKDLADLGIQYGPAFRGLTEIWQGDRQALGHIKLSPEESSSSSRYQIHPAFLDACFQLLGAAIPPSMREHNDKVYVPVGLQKLIVYHAGQSQGWAHVSFSSPLTNEDGSLKDALTGTIKLIASDGTLIAEVIGLLIRQISQAAILPARQRKVEDWLFELNWQLSTSEVAKSTTDTWLIFADESGTGDHLAEQLTLRGSTVRVAKAGSEYRQIDGNNWQLSPTRPAHFQQLLSELKKLSKESRPGVIHLWGLDSPFDRSDQKTDLNLRESERQISGSILHLVQALAENSVSPAGLWLVTKDVHSITPADNIRGITQASIWGLGRTIAMEHPNWNCKCVDISQNSEEALLQEVLSKDDENQVTLRGSERYIARLERAEAKSDSLVVPKGQPFELVIPTPGLLDGLTLQAANRRPPETGEVEIRVSASGLNFRDVLNALGMYPGAKIPLGIECSGVVVEVGEGVTDFHPGDEVIGLTTAAFRSFATIPVDRVFLKPKNVSLTQAASIPTIFLTAFYGLHHLAGMKAGDRVLIHAAAGGVGLAAVQLAKIAGAEIFATAGSPEKRAYLKTQGVQNIFDSRTLDFAEEIMQATDGKGVNIVLNSLADEFIPKSLSVLSDGGCFLEMGKRDDWDQSKVSQLNPTLKYYRYDLGTEMANDMAFIGRMLREILADFEKEVLIPLPLRTFPMASVREAFRYMAQAKHIGKIVISQETSQIIRKDGAYLITGGLGGLGLVTARWLAEQGARYLVLMSRSEPSEQVCGVLDEIKADGVDILLAQGDVSRREDIERTLLITQQRMPPLRGIFHEAGVLDDGVLTQQDLSRFEKVFDPKACGAWHLHAMTQDYPLDLFVLFSSAASVVGSAGQGNYAAANSFLDGLAHYRRSQGLAATSINWGAWADVGMSSKLDIANPKRRAAPESDSINPSEGLKILELLLTQRPAQIIVLPINWNKVSQSDNGKSIQPLLRQIVKVTTRSTAFLPAMMTVDQLTSLPLRERASKLEEYTKQQVIKILGLDESQPFNPLKMLTDLGMDSLMAVELKNRIEGDLGLDIPVTYFLEDATVTDLARKLLEKVDNGAVDEHPGENAEEVINTEKAKLLLENIDQLSESEVDSLLNNLLQNQEES